MKNIIENFEFPVTPCGVIDTYSYYESFLECNKLIKKIPNKEIGSKPDETFLKLLKEVHKAKANATTLYRKRPDAEDALINLWLAKVRERARLFSGYNKIPEFKGLTKGDLEKIARLSVEPDNIVFLHEYLLDFGIILIFEKSFESMKLDGAVFRLENDLPVIAMSLRFNRLDNFWFTLMHELAHVCLHYELLTTPILDDLEAVSESLVEKEADRLAMNSLISRSAWRSCPALYTRELAVVINFARKHHVHPAIVAGRLRKELNRYDLYSGLIKSVDVRGLVLKDE